MKKIFIAIFLLLDTFITYSQVDTLECDYPDRDTIEAENLPWFGNNLFVRGLLKKRFRLSIYTCKSAKAGPPNPVLREHLIAKECVSQNQSRMPRIG